MHNVIGYIMAGKNSSMALATIVSLPGGRLGIVSLKDVATTLDNGENTLEARIILADSVTQKGAWIHWLHHFDLVTISEENFSKIADLD
jgi:hypothetical protein